MYAATARVLWSVKESREGGVTTTTRLLRGLGLRSVHAMSLVHACLVVHHARAYARARARGGGGGGSPSIMVCPLRGNYAESCVSVGGGDYYGMSAPFVFVRMLAKLCL